MNLAVTNATNTAVPMLEPMLSMICSIDETVATLSRGAWVSTTLKVEVKENISEGPNSRPPIRKNQTLLWNCHQIRKTMVRPHNPTMEMFLAPERFTIPPTKPPERPIARLAGIKIAPAASTDAENPQPAILLGTSAKLLTPMQQVNAG